MSHKPLVSVITPCYNGETFVHRYFESILAQTYDNIELIFINDGSIDKTEDIALSYKEKIEARGIEFIYIYQENAGQAAAINKGLEIFKGEYLTWPDSDDWMTSDCIEKKIDFLEKTPNCALVRSDAFFYNENNLFQPIYSIANKKDKINKSIFLDLVFEKTYCCCGCYMVRTPEFLKSNLDRNILVSYGGQNWQMEIPIAYKNLCGFIDKPLYNIVIRNQSHSRCKRTLEEQIVRNNWLQQIKEWSIRQVCPNDKNLLRKVRIFHLTRGMGISYQYKNNAFLENQYLELKELHAVSFKARIIYLRGKFRIVDLFYKGCKIPLRWLRNVKNMVVQK